MRWGRGASMKSLWTRGNTHACTPAHTQTHMLNAYTHTETFQPSQAEAGAAPQRRKEANASTVQLKEKKKRRAGPFFLNLPRRPFTSRILSVVSLSLRLLSLPPGFRSSQTNRSCQTFDVFILLGRDPVLGSKLCLCLPCVCVAVSHFF